MSDTPRVDAMFNGHWVISEFPSAVEAARRYDEAVALARTLERELAAMHRVRDEERNTFLKVSAFPNGEPISAATAMDRT